MSKTTLTPPEGYEIVDRDTERGEGICIGKDWLYLDWVDCRKWVLTRHAGTALFQMPADTIYARPIRAADPPTAPASPWVRASERQPPVDRFVIVRSPIGEPYAYRRKTGWDGLFGAEEWLDLDEVDRLAGENAALVREVRELTQERDQLDDKNEKLAARNGDLLALVCQRRTEGGQDNATEALKWRGRCADAERNADRLTRTNAALLDRIADLERERDELTDCVRETDERLADARAVAERAENAARDAADRLAAYATGGTDNQRDPRTKERLRALGTRPMS